jgi:hypothetical protein
MDSNTGGRGNVVDNLGDIADLVATGIHWSLRWQSNSYLNCGGSDHLDLQLGLWTALISAFTGVRSGSLKN